MRIYPGLLLIFGLCSCNRPEQSKDAVQQSVRDYLFSRQDLSLASVDVELTSLHFEGRKAVATVSFVPRDTPSVPVMTLRYRLEQQGSRWVVVARLDSGHASAAVPGANPKGGVLMPSPEDLPPASGSFPERPGG